MSISFSDHIYDKSDATYVVRLLREISERHGLAVVEEMKSLVDETIKDYLVDRETQSSTIKQQNKEKLQQRSNETRSEEELNSMLDRLLG